MTSRKINIRNINEEVTHCDECIFIHPHIDYNGCVAPDEDLFDYIPRKLIAAVRGR